MTNAAGTQASGVTRWIGVAMVAGLTFVCAGLLVVASFAIGLCTVLGGTCSPGETSASGVALVGSVVVVGVGVGGAWWFAASGRVAVLALAVTLVPAVTLLLGGIAGVMAEKGSCERFTEGLGDCTLVGAVTSQAAPLAAGAGLATVGIALVVIDRRQGNQLAS